MRSCRSRMCRILTIAGCCAVAASAVLVSPDAIARDDEKAVPPKPAAEANLREQLPRGVRIEKDIRYVPDDDEAHNLDLYLPETPAERPLPLIVHIHGGGWRGGGKFPCPVVDMVSRGYAVASVEYRFSQKALFPAQIQDCQAAIRWLRANGKRYGIDGDRFGAIGESAGGHLSALVGTAGGKRAFPAIGGNEDQSDRVQAVCDIYGPANFGTVVRQAADDKNVRCVYSFSDHTNPYSQLIGTSLVGDKSRTDAVSPVHYVSKGCPPMLILHGTHDAKVPFAQSEEFAAALRSGGVPVWLQSFPGAGHGGPAFAHPKIVALKQAFFDRHLKGADVAVELVPPEEVAVGSPAPAVK